VTGSPRKIAVVGGGIAGLATARFLLERSRQEGVELDVRLFERERRLGGHIATSREAGFLIEGGPDCFVSQKPWGLRLASELDLEQAVTGTKTMGGGKTYVLKGGVPHALPDGVMLMVPTKFMPLARTHLLSWPGKLRMGLDLVLPRGGSADETLGDFVRRRLGEEALERIAEPLVAGVHAGNPDRLSLMSTFPRFKTMEDEHRSLVLAMLRARRKTRSKPAAARSAFVTLQPGLDRFIVALEEGMPPGTVRRAAVVQGLEHGAGGGPPYNLGHSSGESGGGTLQEAFDEVVLAVPAFAAAGLLRELAPAAATELGQIEFVDAATVSLGFARADVAHPLDGFGLVIPRSEGRQIMGITWSSSKFPGRAPEGHLLVRAFVGGTKAPELLREDDETLLATVEREVTGLLGARNPVVRRLYRWEQAMPQYNVGHRQRVESIERRMKVLPGVHLAGGSYWGIGIPDCIASADRVASAILGRANAPQ